MFYKGYKIRLLPTPEQEKLFYLKSDTSRFVWNWALGYQMKQFENQQPLLSKFDLMKELRQLKNTDDSFKWIEQAGAFIINQIILDLNTAYQRYFNYRKSGGQKYSKYCKTYNVYNLLHHPKFKSKKNNKVRFPVRYDRTTFYTKENCLSNAMQKYIGTVSIEGCNTVKYQTNYDVNQFNGKVKNARVVI